MLSGKHFVTKERKIVCLKQRSIYDMGILAMSDVQNINKKKRLIKLRNTSKGDRLLLDKEIVFISVCYMLLQQDI
jgi:hypothetical protein